MEFNRTLRRGLTRGAIYSNRHSIVFVVLWRGSPDGIQGIMGESTAYLIEENPRRTLLTRIRRINVSIDKLKCFVRSNGGGAQGNQHQIFGPMFQFVAGMRFREDNPPSFAFVQSHLFLKTGRSDCSSSNGIIQKTGEHKQPDGALYHLDRRFNKLHCGALGRE